MQFERNDGVRSEQLVHFRVLINLKKVKVKSKKLQNRWV
jgi:hypothetical protein